MADCRRRAKMAPGFPICKKVPLFMGIGNSGKAHGVGGRGALRSFETCKVTWDMGLWTQAW